MRASLPDEAQRASRVIATARLFLAVASLVAIYVDPTEPARFASLAYGLLIAYLAYSLAVLAMSRRQESQKLRYQLLLHGIDIVWASSITFLTDGPNSPFYMFFMFVLLAAAYRWGFLETMVSGVTLSMVLLVQAFLLISGSGFWPGLVEGSFDVNRLIMRCAYLLVMGFLLGYLAEEEKSLRAETVLIPRIVANVQVERGLRGSLQLVMGEILRLFGAPAALLALRDPETDALVLWKARAAPVGLPVLELAETVAVEMGTYLFPVAASSWYLERPPAGVDQETPLQLALDREGRRLRNIPCALPPSFPAAHPFERLLAGSVTLGGNWSGRVLLLDPEPGRRMEKELRFFQLLLREVGPAIYNVYLLRRLRSRAGAAERARVARELHDGAVQSLFAVEMKVDVLRRQAGADPARLTAELERIQQLIHDEALHLRELMLQMKPVDLAPHQLLDYLAEMAARFQRETGIETRFVAPPEELLVPPRVAREMARIAQEALANVRRHSGARNVRMTFVSNNGHWQLGIDDNGRGFEFSGRRTLAELDTLRQGPLVIKERTHAMGGELIIESTPGTGTHLEIRVPHKVHG